MRYQVIIHLKDGSRYILEKINPSKSEINEFKKNYNLEKALFLSRLFTDEEISSLVKFLIETPFVAEFEINKIVPELLEEDVVSLSKLARETTEMAKWETISLEMIDGMFIMGYGLIDENSELRRIERNKLALKQILAVINAEITSTNIEKINRFLTEVYGIEDISQYLKELKSSSQEKFSREVEKLKKVLLNPSSYRSEKIVKFNAERRGS